MDLASCCGESGSGSRLSAVEIRLRRSAPRDVAGLGGLPVGPVQSWRSRSAPSRDFDHRCQRSRAKATQRGWIREFWKAKDTSCDIANLAMSPNAETDRHWHDLLTEVRMVARGTGKLELGNRKLHLGPRCAEIITPGVRHLLCNTREGELELYVLRRLPKVSQHPPLEAPLGLPVRPRSSCDE